MDDLIWEMHLKDLGGSLPTQTHYQWFQHAVCACGICAMVAFMDNDVMVISCMPGGQCLHTNLSYSMFLV